MRNKFLFCLCMGLAFSFTIGAMQAVDLKNLTHECKLAASDYTPIVKNFPYKALHTVNYSGWCGDTLDAELRHPIAMKITYAGNRKQGSYWFIANPDKKIKVTARSDLEGNFELKEIASTGKSRYHFHGKMKDGEIKGLWEEAQSKQRFAFYVKAIK